MANTTLPLLGIGVAISDGDIFATRQGADTVDKSITGTQIKTYLGATYVPYTGATTNINLNNKELTNVAELGAGIASPTAKVHAYLSTSSTTTPLAKFQNPSTGDAYSQYIAGGATYSIGVDNSTNNFRAVPTTTPSTTATGLTVTSGGLVSAWNVSPTSYLETGGSFGTNIFKATASSVTADARFHSFFCDTTSNSVTIRLPAASTCTGRIYVIKKVKGGNNAGVLPSGVERIDGVGGTHVLSTLYDGITIQSDATGWWIIAKHL